MAKRIVLMPIDSSEHSRRAFQWYCTNMKLDNDSIIFIHVVEPMYTTSMIGLMEPPPIMIDDMSRMMLESIDEGKRLGLEFIRDARSAGLEPKAFVHIDMNAGAALVKSAKDHQATVIIIGNRGSGLLRRTFLGSVSDYVLHHAHIPVLIVPPQN